MILIACSLCATVRWPITQLATNHLAPENERRTKQKKNWINIANEYMPPNWNKNETSQVIKKYMIA